MENTNEVVKVEDPSGQKKEVSSGSQKKCLICGDKALGYNFNAISCESCKAFFRRNALTNKEFKCPFSNNCEITVVTRRFCQKCRLEKCLAVGMVKEFIMSEEDKAEKRRKIEENRARKRQMLECEDTVSSSKMRKEEMPAQESVQYDTLNSTTCSPHSTVQSPLSTDMECSLSSPPFYPYPQVHSTNTQYNLKVNPIDEKTIINRTVYEQRLLEQQYQSESADSMYADPPKQNSIRSILTNGDTMVHNEASAEHVCEDLPSTSNEADVNKAREILQDVERIEPNSMESILCEAIKLEFEAYTSLNNCSGSSRELNEKINAFKNMCEEDQVALLKGGCIEMLVLRSAMTYDGERNQWKLPHSQSRFGSIRTEVLKLAPGDIYRSHEAFIRSFAAAHRTDEHVILIMSAILLFSPDRAKVVHRDVIKLEQNSYYYLLRRYLESIYPGCEAKSTFLKLIQKTVELRRFAAEVTGVYLDVNPIEPLLMEIFDLKHHPA
ncbi:nuclear hormone receptor HR96 [Zerene cesonia]|uniref:nuclear hormone receptor HR96 n=1 Tax=Zerene cesonia TaxID=33412 RepID=UPI0018E4E855|nr:nuclear hormone receptor HR96 [Zerene cesonia]